MIATDSWKNSRKAAYLAWRQIFDRPRNQTARQLPTVLSIEFIGSVPLPSSHNSTPLIAHPPGHLPQKNILSFCVLEYHCAPNRMSEAAVGAATAPIAELEQLDVSAASPAPAPITGTQYTHVRLHIRMHIHMHALSLSHTHTDLMGHLKRHGATLTGQCAYLCASYFVCSCCLCTTQSF